MTFEISAVDWTVLGLYFVFILGITAPERM